VQSTPEKSVSTKVQIQRHIEERNPYKFIEKTLQEARVKLDKMKGTP
jgi:5-bromo-4-chloroindolyl phosphate hydrolysis protein